MKNIFIKSTLILLFGTIISKILSFFIRIIFTRIIGDGINIYSLIMPTYSLTISLTQLGLPYAISRIVSKNNHRGIHIIASLIPITLIFNVFVIIFMLFFSKFLAYNLLKNPDTYYPLVSIIFVLPFTSISGIIKGYYFGKQNMLPNAISNIFENLTRFTLLVTILPILIKKSTIIAVSGYIIISAISEIIQIIVYLFFLPKNVSFTLHDLKINLSIANEVLSLSIPSVSRILIGNICYFLEPIILTNVLLVVGYSNDFISTEYGIYNAYVIPILTMPALFSMVINTTLIPEISKKQGNNIYIKKLLYKILFTSLIIGVIYCLFLYFNSNIILNILYDTNKGNDYIRILSLIFPFFYIEGPISSVIQGLGLSKYTMSVTFYGCIIKLISMIILSFILPGIYGLIVSEIINIMVVNYLNIKKLRYLKYI